MKCLTQLAVGMLIALIVAQTPVMQDVERVAHAVQILDEKEVTNDQAADTIGEPVPSPVETGQPDSAATPGAELAPQPDAGPYRNPDDRLIDEYLDPLPPQAPAPPAFDPVPYLHRVAVGRNSGSGVCVRPGYLITCWHTFDNSGSYAITIDGIPAPDAKWWLDQQHDVAVIYTNVLSDAPACPLDRDPPPYMAACTVAGFPGLATTPVVHHHGAAIEADTYALGVDDPGITQGYSGGGVFHDGRLIAVVRALRGEDPATPYAELNPRIVLATPLIDTGRVLQIVPPAAPQDAAPQSAAARPDASEGGGPPLAGLPTRVSGNWLYWTDADGREWNNMGGGVSEGVTFDDRHGNRFQYRAGAVYDLRAPAAAPTIPPTAVLVFKTSWCTPCRSPECARTIETLRAAGWPVVEIDADQFPALRDQHRVDHYPTFIVQVDGGETIRTTGTGMPTTARPTQ